MATWHPLGVLSFTPGTVLDVGPVQRDVRPAQRLPCSRLRDVIHRSLALAVLVLVPARLGSRFTAAMLDRTAHHQHPADQMRAPGPSQTRARHKRAFCRRS